MNAHRTLQSQELGTSGGLPCKEFVLSWALKEGTNFSPLVIYMKDQTLLTYLWTKILLEEGTQHGLDESMVCVCV